jgi:hypothetical protein
LCPEQKYRKSRKKAEPESPSNFYAISPPEAESIDAAQPTPVHPAEESQPYLLLPLHLELAVLEKTDTSTSNLLSSLGAVHQDHMKNKREYHKSSNNCMDSVIIIILS